MRSSNPDRYRLVAWFNSRDPRERVLIVVGCVVAAAYIGYVAIYLPLQRIRVQAVRDIATYEAIADRFAANGSSLSKTVDDSQNLPDATVITNSATAIGLVIRRLEPEGTRTSIQVDEADFSVLVDWISLLERDHGLKVATIELDRRPAPGIVSARISVEK